IPALWGTAHGSTDSPRAVARLGLRPRPQLRATIDARGCAERQGRLLRTERRHALAEGVDEAGERHPHLRHRVALADGDRLVVERLEVDGHAQRRADLV